MKCKYLTLLVMCFIALSVSAQSAFEQGDMSLGGSIVAGGDETMLAGVGLKFQYNVSNPIRLEGSLMLFPEQDDLSMTDYSAFAHYLFPLSSGITVYPLVGVGSTKLTASASVGSLSVSYSESYFNLRVGAGMDFQLNENWFLNGELKANLIEDDTYIKIVSFGILYRF